MSKSKNQASESSGGFIDLEIVESEIGKPFIEIEMPRDSLVYLLRWCLKHRRTQVRNLDVSGFFKDFRG